MNYDYEVIDLSLEMDERATSDYVIREVPIGVNTNRILRRQVKSVLMYHELSVLAVF